MTKEIKKELIEAKKAHKAKKYDEALSIYEKNYPLNPEAFNKWDKIFCSGSLYQLYIKNPDEESIYFNVSEFMDGNADVGKYVSYYTELSFDKSKNKESLRAVNIKNEF